MRLDRGQSKVCASVCRPENAAPICSAKDATGFIFDDEIPPSFVREIFFSSSEKEEAKNFRTRLELTVERSLVFTDDPIERRFLEARNLRAGGVDTLG